MNSMQLGFGARLLGVAALSVTLGGYADASGVYFHDMRLSSMSKNRTWTYRSTTTITQKTYYRTAVTV